MNFSQLKKGNLYQDEQYEVIMFVEMRNDQIATFKKMAPNEENSDFVETDDIRYLVSSEVRYLKEIYAAPSEQVEKEKIYFRDFLKGIENKQAHVTIVMQNGKIYATDSVEKWSDEEWCENELESLVVSSEKISEDIYHVTLDF